MATAADAICHTTVRLLHADGRAGEWGDVWLDKGGRELPRSAGMVAFRRCYRYGLCGDVQSAIWLFNHLCKISQYPLDEKMSNQSTLFGCALEQARVISGLSKRKFAAVSRYELRGIQKILKGEREPGVMLALRLVAATGQDVGDFFARLNNQDAEIIPEDVPDAGTEAPAGPEAAVDIVAERTPIVPELAFQRAAPRTRAAGKETNRLREADSCVPS